MRYQHQIEIAESHERSAEMCSDPAKARWFRDLARCHRDLARVLQAEPVRMRRAS